MQAITPGVLVTPGGVVVTQSTIMAACMDTEVENMEMAETETVFMVALAGRNTAPHRESVTDDILTSFAMSVRHGKPRPSNLTLLIAMDKRFLCRMLSTSGTSGAASTAVPALTVIATRGIVERDA